MLTVEAAPSHKMGRLACEPPLDEPEAPAELLIVLDPGKKAAGFTIWLEGELVGAWLARGNDPVEVARDGVDFIKKATDETEVEFEFVSEFPQVYPGIRKEDPNDLLPLAECVGAVSALLPYRKRHIILPRTWTKGTPKDIRIERAKLGASPNEARIMSMCGAPKSLEHNVWDSYALGKWFIERGGTNWA